MNVNYFSVKLEKGKENKPGHRVPLLVQCVGEGGFLLGGGSPKVSVCGASVLLGSAGPLFSLPSSLILQGELQKAFHRALAHLLT